LNFAPASDLLHRVHCPEVARVLNQCNAPARRASASTTTWVEKLSLVFAEIYERDGDSSESTGLKQACETGIRTDTRQVTRQIPAPYSPVRLKRARRPRFQSRASRPTLHPAANKRSHLCSWAIRWVRRSPSALAINVTLCWHCCCFYRERVRRQI